MSLLIESKVLTFAKLKSGFGLDQYLTRLANDLNNPNSIQSGILSDYFDLGNPVQKGYLLTILNYGQGYNGKPVAKILFDMAGVIIVFVKP